MHAHTIKRNARPGALRPRNPLAPAAMRRHAGPHGGTHKRERQQAQRSLRAALREMNEGP